MSVASLALFVVVAVITAVWAVVSRKWAARAKRELSEDMRGDGGSGHKVGPGEDDETPELVPDNDYRHKAPAPSTPQRSLDEQYAMAQGMWVCPRCETINEAGRDRCKACRARR